MSVKIFRLYFLVLCFGSTTSLIAQQLRINEVMASNNLFSDEDGDTPDWIEIYNYGSSAVALGGMRLTDDDSEPDKWFFNEQVLPPDSYLLVWASDKDRAAQSYQTLITEGDEFSYMVPLSAVPSSWTTIAFDDSLWERGASGFGYGDGDDATLLERSTGSVFIRKKFNIVNPNVITGLFLDIDYDDGFAAFINGELVASANLNNFSYNARTEVDHEAVLYNGGAPEKFDITTALDKLVVGENVLCIQVHNINANSSDLSVIPFLTARYSEATDERIDPPVELAFSELEPHTNFKISSSGEIISLFSKTGELIDNLATGLLPNNVSIGVSSVHQDSLTLFEYPTPREKNGDQIILGKVDSEVVFSHPAGIVNVGTQITLQGTGSSEYIRYTTDGSLPTKDAIPYQGTIKIDETKVIRARIFRENYLPSSIKSKSYLVATSHKLPIISLIIDPKDFSDEETGIYSHGSNSDFNFPHFGANFWEDQEKLVSINYFSALGQSEYEFDAGIKIFGGWSRGFDQKSLSLFARKGYGLEAFDFPFFDSRTYTTFQALVLRNAGNDWLRANARDVILTSLLEGSGLDIQANQPVASYINGAYWGLYYLREKINEHYLASKHGLDPDEIDLLEIEGAVKTGSNEDFLVLRDLIETHDLSIAENYDRVAEKIDIENFIIYNVAQIFFNNTDWPGNNIRYWKAPNRKWQYLIYDLDFGFGIWNPNSYSNNTLNFALSDNGPEWPNPPWSTLFFRKLMENLEFRNAFVNRFADELNSRFLPVNVTQQIAAVYGQVNDEMPTHFQRWGEDISFWESQIQTMRLFSLRRPEHCKRHIRFELGLPDFHKLTVKIDDTERGKVLINNRLELSQEEWSGDYFESVPFKLKAEAKPGFLFSHWSIGAISESAELKVNLSGPTTIQANFIKDGTATEDQEREITIELFPNPFSDQLNISIHESVKPIVSIKLLEDTGKLVKVLHKGSARTSQIRVNKNLEKLAVGIYFVELTYKSGERHLFKLVKQ